MRAVITKSRMTLMGTAMEVENEVRGIRREDLPAAAFEIAAGYARRELGAPGLRTRLNKI